MNKRFSIIVDESKNRSTIKYLGLVVTYVNASNDFRDNFLALISLSVADPGTLYRVSIRYGTP